MYKSFFKRLIDILVSALALLALLPLFAVVAIFIKSVSRGRIFYTQDRMGKDKKIFVIYKFRTMTDVPRKPGCDGDLFLDKKNPSMIKGGVLIRRLKIDELPQLLNILIGDMSLVGPRPCLPTPLENFGSNGLRRFDAVPGCTGLAQVNGGIYLTWPERWVYDAKYVENISFLSDMKIILKTFLILLFGEKKFARAPKI